MCLSWLSGALLRVGGSNFISLLGPAAAAAPSAARGKPQPLAYRRLPEEGAPAKGGPQPAAAAGAGARPLQRLAVLGPAQRLPLATVRQASDGWVLVRRVTSGFLGAQGLGVGHDSASSTFHCPFCMENRRGGERVVFAECGREDRSNILHTRSHKNTNPLENTTKEPLDNFQ